MFHAEAGISFLPRVWIERSKQKKPSFLNKPTSFPALAQRRGNIRHSQRLGDITPWLAPDLWGARYLQQKSQKWEQPKAHRSCSALYPISAWCQEETQVPHYPGAASKEGPVILLALPLATIVQNQCTGGEIKNYLFMKKKVAKQLISFCPLFTLQQETLSSQGTNMCCHTVKLTPLPSLPACMFQHSLPEGKLPVNTEDGFSNNTQPASNSFTTSNEFPSPQNPDITHPHLCLHRVKSFV